MDIPIGSRPKPNRAPWLITGLMLVVAGVVVSAGLRTGGKPEIEMATDKEAIGRETMGTVMVKEPRRGLVSVRVRLSQGALDVTLADEAFEPQSAWWPSGPKTETFTVPFKVGKDHQPELKAGPATIEVVARGASTWMFGAQEAQAQRTLPVRLSPPTLSVTAREIYVTQGGAEVVTYTVGETSVRDGVQAGRWFFKGFPRPGGADNERVALFAVPYDMSRGDEIKLTAEDDVGNRVTLPFIDNFRPKPFNTDTINVSESVMKAIVPKIRARTPDLPDKGNLLDNYIFINRELRKRNNATLEALADKTQPKFLWSQPFVQMPAKVVSTFADRRTYRFNGRKIDQQDHLGFDLASVRHAEIPAANTGVVVFADYLGIYGNAVVIDHGLGLMSLYAHCSSVSVEVGDQVERGQVIARTGATGLALGDHLHFTMMIGGLPVTPLEWWDGHWIQDRIARKLPTVFAATKE